MSALGQLALDADQLRTLVQGFKGSALFPVVAVAAFTGARRNEMLFGGVTSTQTKRRCGSQRAIDETDKHGLTIEGPKTERGKRTITIDDEVLSLLLSVRERHLRIKAGIPDGAAVDLSLVNLPADALIFPNPSAGAGFSFTDLRKPRNVTQEFARKAAKLGFPRLRFHDLRGSHETMLLDSGVPVHVVAARCGHDPAVLLRSYAKRTKKADTSAAAIIGALSKGALT